MTDTQELGGLDFTLDETVETARQLVDDVLAVELGNSTVVPSAEAEKRASAALLDTGVADAFDAAGSVDTTVITAIVREIAARAADIPLASLGPS